jgi:hypothetical protein
MKPAGDEHEDFELLDTYESEQGSSAESSADQVERAQILDLIDAEVQNCRRVNAKPSSCVIGRIWMWLKQRRRWVARRQRENTLLQSNHARRIAESQGNKIMNTDDLNFAYKVRHALNEKLDDLPASATDRLAAARKLALSRKKADAPSPWPRAKTSSPAWPASSSPSHCLAGPHERDHPAGTSGRRHGGHLSVRAGTTYCRTGEIDAAVLSDELPLSAYMDHGFNAYLTKREQ